MTQAAYTVTSRELIDHSGWYAFFRWPDGEKLSVVGFDNEAQTSAWIVSDAEAWIADPGNRAPHQPAARPGLEP